MKGDIMGVGASRVLRTRLFCFLGGLLTVILLGCSNPYLRGASVSGIVVDFAGDALPGVSVTVENGDYRALTDARGLYKVRYLPGEVTLQFAKTGFTPGILELNIADFTKVIPSPVELWRLPPEKGVYILSEFRYVKTASMAPTDFTVYNEGVIHGTQSEFEVETANPQPLLVCYKMPQYDVHLTRLIRRRINIGPTKKGDDILQVWTGDASFRTAFTPIDTPAGMLLQLELPGPLEPGVYAVHWGALEGFFAIEDQMHVFRIVSPPKDENEEDEGFVEQT